jgi:hypothetical protein
LETAEYETKDLTTVDEVDTKKKKKKVKSKCPSPTLSPRKKVTILRSKSSFEDSLSPFVALIMKLSMELKNKCAYLEDVFMSDPFEEKESLKALEDSITELDFYS